MIYLISCESNQLINEKLDDIIANNQNVLKYSITNISIEDILTEASYYSLFGEQKIIVVKNADFFSTDKLNEKDNNLLNKYLENPNNLTTLIFITNKKLDMRKTITKVVKEKYNLINIDPLKHEDIYNKTRKLFKDNGYIIDEKSINYLITSCHNNYDLIYNETTKIMLYYDKQTTINYLDVCNLVTTSFEDNSFRLIEALTDQNLDQAFKIYDDLITIKTEPLSILGLIAREYRIMLLIKIMSTNKYSSTEIMNQLNIKEWQYKKFLNKNRLFDIRILKEKLCKLSKADYDLKSSKMDKHIIMKNLFLDLTD